MPTMRPSRRRQRRKSGFTPAELQLLRGESQDNVNRWEWCKLSAPGRPDEIAALEQLLQKGASVVSEARIQELRNWRDGCRNRGDESCPLPPMSREYCDQAEADCKSQYDSSPGMQELGGSWRDYYRFHPVSGAA